MNIAGIDYSLTTPSICVVPFHKDWSFDDCTFYFLTAKSKLALSHLHGKIVGKLHYPYTSEEQRHSNIAQWAIDRLNHVEFIVVEDYAFAAKGKVFNIAENTGLLKHQLWRFQKSFQTIPPTVIKKFATGKGNSNKEAMYEAFLKETGCDLLALFDTTTVASPVNDVADSYFMAKYAHHLYTDSKRSG